MELDNSEKERIINEKIVNLQERDVAISEARGDRVGARVQHRGARGLERPDGGAAGLAAGQGLSDSQEFANQMLEFANQTLEFVEVMNETIAGITVCEGDSVEVDDDGHCVSVRTINCSGKVFVMKRTLMAWEMGPRCVAMRRLLSARREEQYSNYYAGVIAFQSTGYHLPPCFTSNMVGNMCGSN